MVAVHMCLRAPLRQLLEDNSLLRWTQRGNGTSAESHGSGGSAADAQGLYTGGKDSFKNRATGHIQGTSLVAAGKESKGVFEAYLVVQTKNRCRKHQWTSAFLFFRAAKHVVEGSWVPWWYLLTILLSS